MSRSRSNGISAEAQRELEAIDAALAERLVGAEHDSLARLARELRSARPRADEQFLAGLDARAARGFRAGAAGRTPGSSRSPRRRPRLGAPLHAPRLGLFTSRPAVALALTVLLVAAVAVPLAVSGGGGGRHSNANARGPLALVAEPEVRRALKAPGNGAFTTPPPTKAQNQAAGAASAAATPSAPPVGASAPAASPRQVERAASLDVGVAPSAIESTSHQVFTRVGHLGGYVRQSNVSSGGPGQGSASFDIRVPSSNLSEAISSLSGLGHVRSENDTTNDVTDQFSSLAHSLGDLRAERASLLRQLAHASEPQEAATLKERLRELEGRISEQEGSLRALSARINYTALALTLTPEATAGSKHSGDLTPGAAARDAGEILESALAVLVLAVAALLPLGALALAVGIILAAARRRLREQALDAR
jgi:hypothetical protein